MDRAEWQGRWEEGRLAFHQSGFNDLLTRHAGSLWGPEFGRIYVPLCGKSLDMVFLAEHGAEVRGCEYVEQAVAEFFAERGLEPEIDPGPLRRYRADPYALYVADFFDVGSEHLGALDGAFDRAALVALDESTRARYAAHLAGLLPAGARLLLVTFDYDQTEMDGPPFAVSRDEVERNFGAAFKIEELETRSGLPEAFRDRGMTGMEESALALTRR